MEIVWLLMSFVLLYWRKKKTNQELTLCARNSHLRVRKYETQHYAFVLGHSSFLRGSDEHSV